MRILVLNSIGGSKWGGGEKWMLMAAKGLIGLGHHVVVGCRKGSVIAQKAKEQNITVAYIGIRSDISLTGAFDLYRLGKTQTFDVAIGCQNRDVLNLSLCKWMIGSPLVISRQGVKLIRNSWKHKWIYTNFCDGIITNTQTIKDEYDSYGWWHRDFVKVIFNGVEEKEDIETFDFTRYTPRGETNAKIVLAAGRLSTQKGFEYLIDAAEKVCKQRTDVFFFIAGKGKLKTKLANYIEKLDLQKRVIMLGFHNELGSLLKGADVFVLSSLYEGMPNVVMEAMMNKVPVVATNVNGVNELFIDPRMGYVVPPADADSLARAIVECIERPNPQMAENAYQRIVSEFSVHRMVMNLESYLIGLKDLSI